MKTETQEATAITFAAIALIISLLAIFAIGYVYVNQQEKVDLSGIVEITTANSVSIVNLQSSISNAKKDIIDLSSDLRSIDTEDVEDLEDDIDNLNDDINDLEDITDDVVGCLMDWDGSDKSELDDCLNSI